MLAPALGSALAVILPVAYLVINAVRRDPSRIAADLFRYRTIELLGNTVALTFGVLVFASLVALPIAYLTTQTNLRGRSWIALGGVLPLTVPGYIMAYAILALGGYGGFWHRLTGQVIASPKGYWGALLALGMYNMPYMYLNLRAAFSDLDPSLEEAGRSLGHGRLSLLFRVVLPQLRPALLSGALLISLHVIADFGVVSLMQFETFSLALYSANETMDRGAFAVPALVLIMMAMLIMMADVFFLRGLTLHRVTAGTPRRKSLIELGSWSLAAYFFVAIVIMVGVVAPAGLVVFWFLQTPLASVADGVLPALVRSLAVSFPAAAMTVALAIPIALLVRRYPSRWSAILGRSAYIGYAIPSLAFALSFIFISLQIEQKIPVLRGWIYQGFVPLIIAYSLHFLAESIGPIRSGLYLATPRLEESAQALGVGSWRILMGVTLPLLRNSLIISAALVFLSVMKELPITMLLAPINFDTLAVNVWSYSEDAHFSEAAPFALCILLSSGGFVWILLFGGGKTFNGPRTSTADLLA